MNDVLVPLSFYIPGMIVCLSYFILMKHKQGREILSAIWLVVMICSGAVGGILWETPSDVTRFAYIMMAASTSSLIGPIAICSVGKTTGPLWVILAFLLLPIPSVMGCFFLLLHMGEISI